MKNRKYLLLLILSLLPILNLSGISFSGLKVSNDNRLLFKTEFQSQHAIFISALENLSIQQLTAFPEKLQLVDNGRSIIAVNRFGAVRIPAAGGLPVPLPGYPSFAEGNVPFGGRVQEPAVSPDGRWVLYAEPASPAYGNLLLIDTSTGAKHLVSEKVELPASEFPAKWSPNSRFFVYSKSGVLYYFPIISDLSALADERFRMMGPGEANSVLWGQQGDFFYFVGNTLYRIMNPELFTRTIYGDFLSIGSVAAIFPFEFNPGFDKYWIAPDSGSILINKDNRAFFIFLLGENYGSGVLQNGVHQNGVHQNNDPQSAVLPHTAIPYGAEDLTVLWSSSGQLAVITSSHNEIILWRFEITGRQVRNLTSSLTGTPASINGALSPDGTRAVFWGENGVELWDFTNWRLIQRISRDPVFFCAWINNGQFISGNNGFIEEFNISGTTISRRRICLSGADEFGFEAGPRVPSRILARVGTEWFATDGRTPWTAVTNPQLQQVSLSSGQYRVFLESQVTGPFVNIPMIRGINSAGTVSLIAGHTVNSAYAPAGQMQIALCFDLYDDDTGLTRVLAALRRYNIRATFFLNGDFIRRSPLAAAAIAQAGHETASMFYAPINFSDSRYRITHDFIVQGLARNEDEFNHATGRELSLLWHPPFYRSSSVINAAAAAAGYATVTATIDPGDWLSREDALRLNLNQVSASEMIEQILEKAEAGAVIPVRLGLLPGGRNDYLFQRIDVLLDALIRCGIEIVPVSAVIRR